MITPTLSIAERADDGVQPYASKPWCSRPEGQTAS